MIRRRCSRWGTAQVCIDAWQDGHRRRMCMIGSSSRSRIFTAGIQWTSRRRGEILPPQHSHRWSIAILSIPARCADIVRSNREHSGAFMISSRWGISGINVFDRPVSRQQDRSRRVISVDALLTRLSRGEWQQTGQDDPPQGQSIRRGNRSPQIQSCGRGHGRDGFPERRSAKPGGPAGGRMRKKGK